MKDSSPATPPAQASGARHRKASPATVGSQIPPGTKQINAGPLLETAKPGIDPDAPFTVSEAIGVTAATIQATVPALISWGVTVGLIFGGCCSNVFALETIVKEQPDGGTLLLSLQPYPAMMLTVPAGNLITFVQFLVTGLFTWPPHFSASQPPFFLKPRAIPLARWVPNIILFFTVNLLNNYAFGYNISIPVHIILRSGGSITTMLVGFIWGNRYTSVQVFSVAMLTIGIIIAAMADAQSKGKSTAGPSQIDPSFLSGLAILLLAQILSAIMGLYTQITYSTYGGAHWHENLFYSHFLSLPLFLPFLPSLRSQFQNFLSSPRVLISPAHLQPLLGTITKTAPPDPQHGSLHPILASLPILSVPKDVLYLALNALTQYLCITGVNLLSARTTALGVTIVLNMRKLASLLISIWLFGNQLPAGVLLGATVVFGSAGVYTWEGQRNAMKGKKQ